MRSAGGRGGGGRCRLLLVPPHPPPPPAAARAAARGVGHGVHATPTPAVGGGRARTPILTGGGEERRGAGGGVVAQGAVAPSRGRTWGSSSLAVARVGQVRPTAALLLPPTPPPWLAAAVAAAAVAEPRHATSPPPHAPRGGPTSAHKRASAGVFGVGTSSDIPTPSLSTASSHRRDNHRWCHLPLPLPSPGLPLSPPPPSRPTTPPSCSFPPCCAHWGRGFDH